MKSQEKLVIYLEALFAVTIWGCTFIATKFALREVSPASIVWLRFGIGVLILGATVILRQQFAVPKRNEWGYLALTGFLGVTFHQWLQATGLITAQATVTAWIVATIPIFTALLGWFFLKEQLGPIRIIGIVIASFGVLLVVSHGDLGSLSSGKFGTPGDILILISAFNWAVFSVLSRRGLATHPPARMMFYVMLFGWIFACIWLFGLGPGINEIPRLTSTGWLSVLFLAVFGSGLAYIAWYDALKSLPASQLGVFIYIEPLVTMIVAAVMLSETVTIAAVTGGAITIIGIYLVNRA
jgi:drug/metabolite transporter (DMT)-like permease